MPTKTHNALDRIGLQRKLFGPDVDRLSLLEIERPHTGLRPLAINVWRNHNFESVAALATPYLWWAGLDPEFSYGDYDDSFAFGGHVPADLELVWIDSDRYIQRLSATEWVEWLVSRIEHLRTVGTSPIVVVTWTKDPETMDLLRAGLAPISGVRLADAGAACAVANCELLEPRTAAMLGSPIGRKAQAPLARTLACHWICGASLPPIKALALDLDNTLYRGVLGEDGIAGVELTAGHEALQIGLKEWNSKGVFLGLVSKNEPADVKQLLDSRSDFPLRPETLSFAHVSWEPKSAGIRQACSELRIGSDAVLFVDDNPGELGHVADAVEGIHMVFAENDAAITRTVVDHYPGLWRWTRSDSDLVRVQDLRANSEREAAAALHADPADYRRSLEMKLQVSVDDSEERARLCELSGKTNQFNVSLRRFNEAELANRSESPDAWVVGVALSDRLSESGTIALVVVADGPGGREVEELCISCRALGRGLEDAIVSAALRSLPRSEEHSTVHFSPVEGPRNGPALDWLRRGGWDGTFGAKVGFAMESEAALDGILILHGGKSNGPF